MHACQECLRPSTTCRKTSRFSNAQRIPRRRHCPENSLSSTWTGLSRHFQPSEPNPASIPRRSWKNNDVIEMLSGLMLLRGTPEYLRSDNGREFTATKIREWLRNAGVITAYIEPGSPWENGYIESFNSRMRDEFLNGNCSETCMKFRCWRSDGFIITTRCALIRVSLAGRLRRKRSYR